MLFNKDVIIIIIIITKTNNIFFFWNFKKDQIINIIVNVLTLTKEFIKAIISWEK